MTLAFRIIRAAYCSGTHHKLAMDSLLLLKNGYKERWRDLFLKHAGKYVEGSKAPDNDFRDFSNHVLHVEDGFWGGADEKAFVWYEKLVSSLKAGNWEQAAYDAGVLSHYYTDPIQPFHTAQSKKENDIHRAFEWSISRSYEELSTLGHARYPDIKVSQDDSYDWLERLVRKGATRARAHYETLVESYDFDKGVKNPPEGLNEESRKILGELIRYASVGFAGVLDRAFRESEIIPPFVDLRLDTVIAGIRRPVKWVVSKLEDRAERKLVTDMYKELRETGKVEKNLPEDDRLVRDLYIEEVLEPKEPGSLAEALENLRNIAQKMREVDQAAEAKVGRGNTVMAPMARVNLLFSDPVEKAPSIGKKTASRLAKTGINTVDDLLKADCNMLSSELNIGYVTPEKLEAWQDQARLVCDVPGLWGHDAQLLVAVECRTIDDLLGSKPKELQSRLADYVKSSEGERILRTNKEPNLSEILDWISSAEKIRAEKAA